MRLFLQCAAGLSVVAAMMLAFSLYLQYDDYRRKEAAALAGCLRADYAQVLVAGKWIPGVQCTETVNTATGERRRVNQGDRS